MKHFLRPYQSLGVFVVLAAGIAPISAPASAQSTQMIELLQGTSPLLLHTAPQGYLGVWVDDIDADKAQTLKLKDVRGAVITIIDHDAPAGKIGLRVNDVVVQLNGQNVEGAEQLRRMLKEIPPGHKVSLEFSRDGNVQTTSVELVDHRAMEHDVWNKLDKNDGGFSQTPAMGVLPGAGDASLPGMFHMPIFGSSLNVGAMVEPLVGQTAEFLGISNGLMVKQVTRKSEAAAAGLKAKDIILKVGPDAVTTLSDWDRALRSNQGKQVQITILRDGKQQTVNLQVDSSKRKTGALEMEPVFPADEQSMICELKPETGSVFARDDQASAALREQAHALTDDAEALGSLMLDPGITQQFSRDAAHLRDQFQGHSIQIDPARMEQMRRRMEEFTKGFSPDALHSDPKTIEDFKERVESFQVN